MKKNIQIIALVVLAVIMVLVWSVSLKKVKRARGTNKYQAALTSQEISGGQDFPFWGKKSAKKKPKSAFGQWGRNPFTLAKGVTALSGVNLMGILWDSKSPQAIINDAVVGINDTIEGNKVLDIQRDRVIIYNGKETLELRLWEENQQ
jgi:hypothetical protein